MSEQSYAENFGMGSKLLSLDESQKLKIGVDGFSNIDDWSTKLSWLLKAAFGEYARVVSLREIPAEWTRMPILPTKAQEEAMSSLEKEAALQEFKEILAVTNGWKKAKARIIPHIIENLSKASLERILEREKEAFELAISGDNVPDVLKIIHSAHRYKNRDAKKETEINLSVAFMSFALNSSEKITDYKNRWDVLMRQMEAVGIPKNRHERAYFFLRGLKTYPSLGIRAMVTRLLCELEEIDLAKARDGDTKTTIALFDEMSAILAAESGSGTKGGAPMALTAVAAGAAGRMTEKIKRGAITGNNNGDAATNDKVDGGARNGQSGNTTERLVEKKMSQGMTRKEALKDIVCHNCGKSGHIKVECRSATRDESKKPKRKTKRAGDALIAEADSESDDEDEFRIDGIDCYMLCQDVNETREEDDGWTTARRKQSRPDAKRDNGLPRSRSAVCAYSNGTFDALQSESDEESQPRHDKRLQIEVGAYAISSGADAEKEANKMFFFDDTLANVVMVHNTDLLTNVRKLATPLSVSGVGGAQITEVGDHPFLGRALVLRHLKYNIVPHGFWTRKHKYSVSIAPDGSWLRFARTGCTTVEFREHITQGRFFRRVHNSMLRWQGSGTVTPPPRFVADDSEGRDIERDAEAYTISERGGSSGKFYTPEQRQRAAEAAQLHVSLGHPSDEVLKTYVKSPSLTNCHLTSQDITHMRDIDGPCAVCLAGKPRRVRGRNSLHESLGVTEPGQLLHCDIVFWNKRTYLLCVDEITGYLLLPQIASKRGPDVMTGFKTVIDALRAAHRVVQYIHTDAEAVFESIREQLHEQGVSLKLRIPGEHEVVAERAFRSLREKIRVHIISLQQESIIHPQLLDPYLVQHCVSVRNRTPNSRSGSALPYELIYGERVNFLTDCRVGYMNLVLTAVPSAGQTNPTVRVSTVLPRKMYRSAQNIHVPLMWMKQRLLLLPPRTVR